MKILNSADPTKTLEDTTCVLYAAEFCATDHNPLDSVIQPVFNLAHCSLV